MNSKNVPLVVTSERSEVLEHLQLKLPELTPELHKAAAYVLENPNDVSVLSMRAMASAANIKPNTLVRLARCLGFESYEDFRHPFRQEVRRGSVNYPDRARWLQSIGRTGKLGSLYRQMVSAAIENIEETFSQIDEAQLHEAARLIWNSRHIFTLGVGVNNSNAQNFTYLASTGMIQFFAIPRPGSTPIDDLAWANESDVLIAITCKPYRVEVVEAVKVAHEQGVKVIAITDSAASPIMVNATQGFMVSADTPQFFPSSVSTIALLETLLSFVIASASPKVVKRVKQFHDRRHQLGIYQEG